MAAGPVIVSRARGVPFRRACLSSTLLFESGYRHHQIPHLSANGQIASICQAIPKIEVNTQGCQSLECNSLIKR